jgi:hypothetical protein
MEQQLQSEQEHINEQEYIQGFNDAALITRFEPDAFAGVELANSETVSAYLEGFLDFKEYLKQEAVIDKEMEELSNLRNHDKEKEGLERE